MAIENTVLAIFDPPSSTVESVFDCRLSSVILGDKGFRDAHNGICDNPIGVR